jgi:hypothetical protein
MSMHLCLSQVSGNNLDWLQPQQAGLRMLSLDIWQQEYMKVNFQVAGPLCGSEVLSDCMQKSHSAKVQFRAPLQTAQHIRLDSLEMFRSSSCLQGLCHLTSLTRLEISAVNPRGYHPLSAVAGLTTLQCLCLPPPHDPSLLSTLR